MKKKNVFLLVFGFAVIIASLSWLIYNEFKHKAALKKQVAMLPDFKARMLNGKVWYAHQIVTGPVIIINFSPDCDHCLREAKELNQYLSDLKEAKVVWISTDSLSALQHFANINNFTNKESIRVVQVEREVASKSLGLINVPSMLAYHADKTLAHRYMGETSIQIILHQL